MAIDKLSFGNTAPARLPQAIKPEGEQKELQAADNKMSVEDKEKSNAAKYMIGAAALAAAVAVGIIGHKQGWFSKAVKKGGEEASDAANKAGKEAEKQAAEAAKETGKPLTCTVYQSDGKTLETVREYDPQTGKVFKCTDYQDDGKTFKVVREYDPQTGKRLKETNYVKGIETAFNPDGSVASETKIKK